MQEYFIEQGHTYAEAERKAREKYGELIKVMLHETIKIPGGFLNLFSREGVRITGIIPSFNRHGLPRDPIAQPVLVNGPLLPNVQLEGNFSHKESSFNKVNKNFAEEKEKLLTLAGGGKNDGAKDGGLKEVLAEVRSIKEKLESSGLAGSREEHPTINRLDDVLILNDFTQSYRKAILERVWKSFSPNELNNYDKVQDKVLEWIGESIKISENEKFNVRPKIMILVGPTGVGKTTTVAKLAANFGIDSEKGHQIRRVVLVTIDAYRIGAKEQLEVYSDVMQFPCFPARDYDELKKIIALNSDNTDLIIVDTIGKSPRDAVNLGEMKLFLDACGTLTEVHLVVAATTKSSDIKEIIKTFEPFHYRSVIITKMDETIRMGNVISALSENAKSISYTTDGQKVPVDINKASIMQFLINLEGFKVNRVKLEEKFLRKSQGQMQSWR